MKYNQSLTLACILRSRSMNASLVEQHEFIHHTVLMSRSYKTFSRHTSTPHTRGSFDCCSRTSYRHLSNLDLDGQHQACLWRCYGEWFGTLSSILSSPDRLSPVLETRHPLRA
ncbi:unnamed protein product [Ectocarpus fasciculatus]